MSDTRTNAVVPSAPTVIVDRVFCECNEQTYDIRLQCFLSTYKQFLTKRYIDWSVREFENVRRFSDIKFNHLTKTTTITESMTEANILLSFLSKYSKCHPKFGSELSDLIVGTKYEFFNQL